MNELIRITENNGRQAVSARELYEKLGYKDNNFTKFCRRFITQNRYAAENIDYQHLVHLDDLPYGGRRKISDYALSIDFAKKICMLSRTETGEQIRNYFIEVEKRATKPLSQLDILAQSVQVLQAQEKRLSEVEDRVKVIEAKTTPRPNYFTIVGYATLHKVQCGLSLACRLGRKAATICKNRGIETEEIPDPRFGKVKTYPEDVLKEVFEMPIN